MAGDIPTAQLDPSCQWSPDMDQTAHGALSALGNVPAGDHHERAGVIFQRPDGQYCYSTPMTMGDRDDFALRAQLGDGMKLAGIYHTHPGDDDFAQYFSPQDLQIAHQLNVPSYVKFMKDGSLKKYVPGKTSTMRIDVPGSPFGLKASRGDPLNLNDDKARKFAIANAYASLTK